MRKKINLLLIAISSLLPLGVIAENISYTCSCIGWHVNKEYRPCITLKNQKEQYKLGTVMKNLNSKDITLLITNQRIKYLTKGNVYEPDTGWLCNQSK